MLSWADPFPPFAYFSHTIIGSLGVLLALAALALTKGTIGHKRAGWGFVAGAAVAAVTAIIFSGTQPAPMAIASALMVLALLASAVVALRPASRGVRAVHRTALGLLAVAWLILAPLGSLGMAVALGVMAPPQGMPVPPLVAVAVPVLYSLFPLWFIIDEWRFFRLPADARRRTGFARHLSRMAFALAIAVHAPVVSFADDLNLPPLLAFFGPFVIWPIVLMATRRHPLIQRTSTTA